MLGHSIAKKLAKQDALKEIVARLGEAATTAQIREEAYRVGFGTVHSCMLAFVRNQLWPERKKRNGGDPRQLDDPKVLSIITCPSCRSTNTENIKSRKVGGLFDRKYRCRECFNVYENVSDVIINKSERYRSIARNLNEKKCTTCDEVLPISAFSRRGSCEDTYRPSCRACLNRARAENQFKSTLKQHGLTSEQYERIVQEQEHACAICRSRGGNLKGGNRKSIRKRHYPLNFDHCHKSGKFRGLLCDKCNLGIGNFDDDVERMQAAVDYLRRHQELKET